MENYVLPILDGCITNCIIPWMSKFGFHTFTLIINFITHIGCLVMWQSRLFEIMDILGITIVAQVKEF
jgi:hypothetical protein